MKNTVQKKGKYQFRKAILRKWYKALLDVLKDESEILILYHAE